jgi:hypothetical protein
MRDDERALESICEADNERLIEICTTSNTDRARGTTTGTRDVQALRRMRWEGVLAEALEVRVPMTKSANGRAWLQAGDGQWTRSGPSGVRDRETWALTLVALRECFRTKRP